jgi:hypothetical protein
MVSASDLGTFSNKKCVNLYQMCDSCTYVNLTSIKTPTTIINENVLMTKVGSDYNYTKCNLTELGEYSYTVCGDKAGYYKCEVITFKLSPNGENVTTGGSIFYLGLLVILILLFSICLINIFKTESIAWRMGLLSASYILLLGILYAGKSIADNFLLSVPAISIVLGGLLMVLVPGFFIYIIALVVYMIFNALKEKEIKSFVARGMTEDEARTRIKQRK